MANFYKKPFIYLPRQKKIVQGNKGSGSFGALAEEHAFLKSTISDARLLTFWTTPQPNRTSGVPPLYLYDPVTDEDQEVNYSTGWSNTSHRLYCLMMNLDTTPSNIPNTRWADPHNWWSNVVLPVIFLYVSFTNDDDHLYKISSPDMFNNYRMTPHTSQYSLSNSNGYIRGVYMDETRYSNLINNQTIQDTINGHNRYDSTFIYLQEDVSDKEILNICQTYGFAEATQVEPLTI